MGGKLYNILYNIVIFCYFQGNNFVQGKILQSTSNPAKQYYKCTNERENGTTCQHMMHIMFSYFQGIKFLQGKTYETYLV